MKFNPDSDIPELEDKVIIVTGGKYQTWAIRVCRRLSELGNAGLGLETIRQLVKHNPARIYLAARSRSKAETAISDIKNQVGDLKGTTLEFLELDLTSFASIRDAARTFNAASDRLDLLINNAGIVVNPYGMTQDGYEIHFGTNHIGPALFTLLMLPVLKRTAASGSDVRVVMVASAAHRNASNVYPYAKFQTDGDEIGWWQRYALSKLANVHFAKVLAQQNPEIKCVAADPGAVNTSIAEPFYKEHPWLAILLRPLKPVLLTPVSKGVFNQLWAATAVTAKSGVLYKPVGVEEVHPKCENMQAAEELWTWTQKQIEAYL
jgi:NAD(P)-dependent dehydrogenase (short-subunit alcohol dehydrogenase family)